MNSDSAPSAIEAAATTWLARRDRGLTPAEQDGFLQWLAEDPRHRECFAQHQQTWGELDALAQWRPAHSAVPNPDLLARGPAGRVLWLTLGAAAALLLAAGFVGLSRQTTAPAPLPSQAMTARDFDQKVRPL